METELCCRICLDEGKRYDFIAPCQCAGSSRWVHRTCLDRWRCMREDRAFAKCTECLTPYKLVCPQPQESRCARVTRHVCFVSLVLRDLTLVFIVCQIFIIASAFTIYLVDTDSALPLYFKMNSYPRLMYYLVGLFALLAVIGVFAVCTVTTRGSCCRTSNDNCICIDAYCLTSGPHNHRSCLYCYYGSCDCCQCCLSESTIGSVANGAGVGAGAAPCECGHCAQCCVGCQLSEDLAICFVALVVVFAAIGVFVCVIVGVVAAQMLVERHVHILRKMSLAKDFIVADLASDALPLPELSTFSSLNEEPCGDNCQWDAEDSEAESLWRGRTSTNDDASFPEAGNASNNTRREWGIGVREGRESNSSSSRDIDSHPLVFRSRRQLNNDAGSSSGGDAASESIFAYGTSNSSPGSSLHPSSSYAQLSSAVGMMDMTDRWDGGTTHTRNAEPSAPPLPNSRWQELRRLGLI